MDRFAAMEKHPNPAFCREAILRLDGEWQFGFDKENRGLMEKWQEEDGLPEVIQVPYVYQAPLSGIGRTEACEVVWYKRRFSVPADFQEKHIFLHFGAVDYEAMVFINGRLAGTHRGGYSSFSFDITFLLRDGDNDVTVRVFDDDYGKAQMRGKQIWDDTPFGSWYTRYTGIWQPVWLEALETLHLRDFTIEPRLDSQSIRLKAAVDGLEPGMDAGLRIQVTFQEKPIASAYIALSNPCIELSLAIHNRDFVYDGMVLWSPESPNLYEVALSVEEGGRTRDRVDTYFGMRKLEIRNGQVYLNNAPYYQRLILNQGYYPGGLITPESDARICDDIRLIKEAGYNGMRIHQKVESSRFLYWCDRLGVLVWEEMPSMYEYRESEERQILSEFLQVVERDKNHPCIFTWVLFNESWGVVGIRFDKRQQDLTRGAYYAVRAADPTRFIVSNDGWEHTVSDLCTLHDYAAYGDEILQRHLREEYLRPGSNPEANDHKKAFVDEGGYGGQPYLMSEYGGISFSADSGWGYNGKVDTEEAFLQRFAGQTAAIKKLPHMQGYCYTQFTDVEHEQNGLLRIDRVPKVPLDRIRAINLG